MQGIHSYWDGRIPRDWQQTRCRDRFDLINGFPFPSDGFNLDGRGFPLIRIRDILSGHTELFFEGTVGLDCTVEDGDIVIGMDGDFNVAWWDSNTALLNQRICALRPKAGIDPRFAFYQLPISLKIINDLTPSSTVKHLSSLDVLSLRIWAPELDAQKEIVEFLNRETARIDQLIAKRQRFTEIVLERRGATISHAVTGSSNDAGAWLGDLSQEWKAERAKFHFRESQDRSETGEEELLTVSHITGVTKRSEKDVNMFLAESNEGYKLVAPDDLIINTMWAWMGAMGVSSEHGLISPSYGVYRPITEQLRPKFVDLMVRSKPFVAEATRRSKGIHSSRLRLYPDAFLDMLLPIPPLATQDAILTEIAMKVAKEDELLRKNKTAEDLLCEFRSALVTSAVTGQIDVATWVKRGETDQRLDAIKQEMVS